MRFGLPGEGGSVCSSPWPNHAAAKQLPVVGSLERPQPSPLVSPSSIHAMQGIRQCSWRKGAGRQHVHVWPGDAAGQGPLAQAGLANKPP